MNLDYYTTIGLIILVIIVDLFKVKFKIKFSNENLLLITGKVFGIAIAYLTFRFGLNILLCVNDANCFKGIAGLDILLVAIGILCIIISIFGYIIILINYKPKKRRELQRTDKGISTSKEKKTSQGSSAKVEEIEEMINKL